MKAGATASIELACSLTDAQLRERRAIMRKALLPYVYDCRLRGLELVMDFSERDGLRSDVKEFVNLERQCCRFLTFTVSPPGEKLTLTIVGPEGSQSTLKVLADAAVRN